MKKRSIVFYDDEGWIVQPYVVELEKDFEVHFFEDVTNGEQIVANPEIKLLILDVMMPTPTGVAASATNNSQSTGIWFLKQIRNTVISRPLPVIVLTNRGISAVKAEIDGLGFDPRLVFIRSKNDVVLPSKLRQVAKELADVWYP
jgi:CheY-like chemotaxis protein